MNGRIPRRRRTSPPQPSGHRSATCARGLALLLVVTCAAGRPAEESFRELDPQRIATIAALLPEQPAGLGRPISDRKFWDNPALHVRLGAVVADAAKLLPKTLPAWNDEDYLEYSRVGRREAGQKMMQRRAAWLYPLVMAEGLENKGRFTAKLNQVLDEYAAEPTWTMPAHDHSLDNFHRRAYEVDLRSAAFGWELAQALYLLGDRIAPATRQRVLAALEQRVWAPFRHTLATGRGNWWLGSKAHPVQNNWNPVCLSGICGAALAALPDRRERALFLAAAEHHVCYYLNSFRADGYCDEGVGYWNYGFGSFLHLREILFRATGGQTDLCAEPKVRQAALYGIRIQIVEQSVPAFADCHFGTKASPELIQACDRVLGLGRKQAAPLPPPRGSLATVFLDPTPGKLKALTGSGAEPPAGLRSYFDQAGVLVCRPAPGSGCRLGAAIKAGGNSSHSHNDVGSFVIALGREEPVGEPGGPHSYTSQTFSKERYTLKLLNSFGHPVPVVAGRLQVDATRIHPQILSTRFTDAADEISMDLACAYAVPELKKLVRTLRYERRAPGAVTIADDVAFDQPAAFELGLPTNGSWKQTGPKTLEFSLGAERLTAEIETPDGFEVTTETIAEQSKPPFTRLGLRLKQPVRSARVTVRFRPGS